MPFIFKHERKALRGSIHQRFSHFLYDEEVVELLVGYQFQIFIKVIISEVRPGWLSEFVCNELRMETNRRIFRRMRFSPTADGRDDRYKGIYKRMETIDHGAAPSSIRSYFSAFFSHRAIAAIALSFRHQAYLLTTYSEMRSNSQSLFASWRKGQSIIGSNIFERSEQKCILIRILLFGRFSSAFREIGKLSRNFTRRKKNKAVSHTGRNKYPSDCDMKRKTSSSHILFSSNR